MAAAAAAARDGSIRVLEKRERQKRERGFLVEQRRGGFRESFDHWLVNDHLHQDLL